MPCHCRAEPGRHCGDEEGSGCRNAAQGRLNLSFLAYNTQQKPFDDVRVRKALNMAVNKAAIIDAVYLGSAVPSVNPLPPSVWGYNKNVKDDAYDPEQSRKMLDEAGVKDLKMKIWAMPVQRPYMPNARRAAELIQSDFAKVGVTAEIVTYDWGRISQAFAGQGPRWRRHAWLDRRHCRSRQLPRRASELQGHRQRQSRQLVRSGFREAHSGGQADDGSGRAHQALRTGAGRVQGTGAVADDRPSDRRAADQQEGPGFPHRSLWRLSL
ncbi:extracellular solute-binding protein [Brucella intermedia M86]|uniref:Extracellular solute-binding protein n=1 Tax=Brucella intermedia M86 TaxID=1234597 RepID=M5K0Z4_9HYPH|nr:extracellular solute-binding protein [Brucella intermedia M86]